MVGRALVATLAATAARFLRLLPALLLAWLLLRAAELVTALPPGPAPVTALRAAGGALADDAYALARHLPLLFIYSLPALLLRAPRARRWCLGVAWSLLLALQAALIQYSTTARVPLGADLYAYSWQEVSRTVGAGLQPAPAIVAGTLLALLTLWFALARLLRHESGRMAPAAESATGVWVIGAAVALLLIGPPGLPRWIGESEDAYSLRLNKAAFFIDDSIRFVLHGSAPASSVAPAARYPSDPDYPFLHPERTADELGPHFRLHREAPANLVFIIVEGLGRAFSGPDAAFGSFTPFLDQLAAQGLYWENFLAVQGRTFAALPSIFGSLPFGEQGFEAMSGGLPEHATLLSVLRANGYRLNYYAGTNLDFDDERSFLRAQGIELPIDASNFPPGYARSNDWGYADNELISAALADEARSDTQPFVTVLQTNTMHSPYTFLGQQPWRERFEQRLGELGVAESQKASYRAYRDIYSTVLYLDDALRRYFQTARQRHAFGNTIFIITGDHRLPELPMDEWIDRYHVPLIIYSPMLTAPQRIKSISSDFDLAPSLLALLAHGCGLKTPAHVTWVGTGLDLEPAFRNVHEFPLKQTKTNLVDYIDGTWMQSRGLLYSLSDGLHMDPVHDEAAQQRVAARFAAFAAANERFARTRRLAPRGSFATLAGYGARPSQPPAAAPAAAANEIAVGEVSVPAHAAAGQLPVDVTFSNAGAQSGDTFVPLVVLLSPGGRELSESYGRPVKLGAKRAVTVRLQVRCEGVAAGRYFLNVLPSHPVTGRRTGTGRYHIPVVIDG
jgi:phosphoglycerol transferase MdoB-like AlkP superfamily enzyme